MIKTLNLIESMDLNQGGPPEVIRNLKMSFNKDKCNVSVLSLNRIKTKIFFEFFFCAKGRSRLYKFLNKYDLIHAHTIWSFKVALIVSFANSLGIKVIFNTTALMFLICFSLFVYGKINKESIYVMYSGILGFFIPYLALKIFKK